MATKEELQKQLATIEAGLLDFSAVGEQAFLKQTGQRKLTKTELPRYTDVYNKEFEAIKDIQFSIGGDAATASKTDKAFYVFDPARAAKQKTEQVIQTVEQANLAATKQQEDIKKFLASEKEAAKSAVLQSYLSSVLNPQITGTNLNPFEWETIDINSKEGWSKWQAVGNNADRRYARLTYNPITRQSTPVFAVKLTAAQAAEKRKTTEAIERLRFMSSPSLQKTYAEKYRQQLQAQLKKMK